jgi:hypothetical protein
MIASFEGKKFEELVAGGLAKMASMGPAAPAGGAAPAKAAAVEEKKEEVEDVDIDSKWNAKDILRLEHLEAPTEDQIKSCEEHLKEEGFFLYEPPNRVPGDFILVGIGNSIKEYCINWLNENFSDMVVVPSKVHTDCMLYRYKPKSNILFYNKEKKTVSIHRALIWSFFENILCIYYNTIGEITMEWLSETYNLKGVDTAPARHLNLLVTE